MIIVTVEFGTPLMRFTTSMMASDLTCFPSTETMMSPARICPHQRRHARTPTKDIANSMSENVATCNITAVGSSVMSFASCESERLRESMGMLCLRKKAVVLE